MGLATRIGVGVGLIGGTVLTIIVGLTMGGSPGHHVGVEPAGAARMPITGWSLTVGDRRVPHFFATHMMQAVPVAGLLLDMIATRWIAVGGVTMFAACLGRGDLVVVRASQCRACRSSPGDSLTSSQNPMQTRFRKECRFKPRPPAQR
jgi:hypothetical protein